MGETIVNLERLPDTSEEECLGFLRCLYSRIGQGPNRDKSADAERELQLSDGLQPVPVQVAGDHLDTARAAVSAAAQACDPNWPRLYRFAD